MGWYACYYGEIKLSQPLDEGQITLFKKLSQEAYNLLFDSQRCQIQNRELFHYDPEKNIITLDDNTFCTKSGHIDDVVSSICYLFGHNQLLFEGITFEGRIHCGSEDYTSGSCRIKNGMISTQEGRYEPVRDAVTHNCELVFQPLHPKIVFRPLLPRIITLQRWWKRIYYQPGGTHDLQTRPVWSSRSKAT